MSSGKRQFFILGGIILVLIILIVLGYVFRRQTNETPKPQPGDQSQKQYTPHQDQDGDVTTGKSEHEIDEHNHNTFLENLDILAGAFTDMQYLYINQAVNDYARTNHREAKKLDIDPDSFTQRSPTSYGFSIRGDGSAIFYVIATKKDNGEVELKFYDGGGGA